MYTQIVQLRNLVKRGKRRGQGDNKHLTPKFIQSVIRYVITCEY